MSATSTKSCVYGFRVSSVRSGYHQSVQIVFARVGNCPKWPSLPITLRLTKLLDLDVDPQFAAVLPISASRLELNRTRGRASGLALGKSSEIEAQSCRHQAKGFSHQKSKITVLQRSMARNGGVMPAQGASDSVQEWLRLRALAR